MRLSKTRVVKSHDMKNAFRRIVCQRDSALIFLSSEEHEAEMMQNSVESSHQKPLQEARRILS